MKRTLFLLTLIVLIMSACSKDDDKGDQTQDYTSFVVTNSSEEVGLPNVVVGYLTDGKYIMAATVGDLPAKGSSREITISPSIKGVYFFSDYVGGIKINKEYKVEENRKNEFTLSGSTQTIAVTNKQDPTQYPQ